MNFFDELPHELLKRIYYYVSNYMDLILYTIAPFHEFYCESVTEGFTRSKLMEYIVCNPNTLLRE